MSDAWITGAARLAVFACLIVVSLVCMRCSSDGADDASSSRPDVVRFADTGLEGMEELRRSYGEFVRAMEEALDVHVEFFPVGNRTIAAVALEHGQVDVVLAGPTEYLFIRSRQDVHPLVGIERERYSSAFYVPVESPAQSISDLRGMTIAFKDLGSTSGHVMPISMLLEAGLDPDRDVEIRMLGGARIEAFLNGEVQALGDGIKTWSELERRAPGRFRILAESGPLPRDILIARNGLPQDFVDEMRSRMLEHGEKLMTAMLSSEENDKYAGARFIRVEDAEYDGVRAVHRRLGLPFDR